MYHINSVYCSRCGEFIGNLGKINQCPICGYDFEKKKVDQKKKVKVHISNN